MAEQHFRTEFERELQRLGLNIVDVPGLAVGPGGADALLAHVRSLPVGATWRDVFPDMPAHWVPGRPSTWTGRYRPRGPYDYQELPTGPAVHVKWPKQTDRGCLGAFIADARAAGWPIYGGGFIEMTNPEWPTLDAMLVLERGTSEDTLFEFVAWIEEQPRVRLATIPRTGQETYAP